MRPQENMTEQENNSPERNPGDTYVEGLKALMKNRGVTLDEAERITREDFIATHGEEHLEPLAQAVRYLKSLENK